MAYQVASRRHEIGIRKAVGSTDARLVGRIAAAARPWPEPSWGSGPGTRCSHGSGGWWEGIDRAGTLVPVAVAVVVGGCCVVATLVPAFRATRVDPVVTLKAE